MRYAIIIWDSKEMVYNSGGEVYGWYSGIAEALIRCLEYQASNPMAHAVVVKMV